MTTDQGGSAEEFLRALAADLVEELSAGRAVELANQMAARDVPLYPGTDDDLELSVFNVRGFQRTVTTKSGQRITETVRPHGETRQGGAGGAPGGGAGRFVAGADPGGGHVVHGYISQAKWDANKWKKHTAAVGKISESVKDSRLKTDQLPGDGSAKVHGRLATAQYHLKNAQAERDPDVHGEHLGNAYSALAEAHDALVQHTVPAARSSQDRKAAQDMLGRVQGHLKDLDELTGSRGATTKQIAADAPSFDSKRAKGLDKLHEGIGKTLDQVAPNSWSGADKKNPAGGLWMTEGIETRRQLEKAQSSLRSAQSGDTGGLAEVYHHLAEAHQHGVESVLPRATPENKDAVLKHLDLIKGHMEDLDKLVGSKSGMTGKIVGTTGQQGERAAKVRDDARAAIMDAAEKGDYFGVTKLEREHKGLIEPELVQTARERAHQVERDKAAQDAYQKTGLKVGDTVRATLPSWMGGTDEGHITDFATTMSGSVVATVELHNRKSPDDRSKPLKTDFKLDDLKSVQPDYPRGASAIYPNAGMHARAVTAGGTLSGHENAHRISTMPVAQQQSQTPVEAELAKLKDQTARFAQREAQRRDSDLQGHLADMKAAEAAYRGKAAEGQYRPLEDQEYAARKDFVASQVETALRAGLATDKQFSLDGKGMVWSPERATLHAEIVRDFMDRHVDVPTERQALFMGGLPGAGKSTTLKGHPDIDLKNYAVLNPDKFKEDLMNRGAAPEVPGLSPMETAALVHEESAYLTDLVAHEMERRGKNVAWDVTMKNHDITADRVKLLKRKGYQVHAVFVDVPVEKSADRVENRYRKGLEKYRQGSNDLGGRFIPRSVILAGEGTPGVSRAKITFQELKPEFKSWEHYDGTNYPAKLVDKSGDRGETIPSVEALRAMSTEQGAQAAESGQTAEGLTHTNPSGSMSAEESESS